MTLSNPITCGHFSTPDTSSSFHRHRSARRAGQAQLPTAAELGCLFLHATRKDGTGYQRRGWRMELCCCAGFRLGSESISVFFSHGSCHRSSCTAVVMKKIYCYCSHRAKKQEPSKATPVIKQHLQPWETCKAFPSPENIPLLLNA